MRSLANKKPDFLHKSNATMKFLFIFFLLPLRLLAQDITGVWTGTLYNDTTKQYLKYELAISEYNGKLSGYSHTIFVIDSVENIGVKSIKIKKSGEDYLVEDDKLIYNNYTAPPAKGVKTYSDLELSETDSSMLLKGSWKTNATRTFRSITGNIYLTKKKKIEETLIIPKLQNLGVAKSLSFMPYNNYSNDVATTKMTNDNRPESIQQNQNPEPVNSSKNNVDLNSPREKEVDRIVKPISIDTQQVTTTDKSILNPSLIKAPEKEMAKEYSPVDAKLYNTPEKKEIQIKSEKISDSNKVNIMPYVDEKNQQDKKIVAEAGGLSKRTETTAYDNQVIISKKDTLSDTNRSNESARELSLKAKPVITQKVLTKVSSVNTEVDNIAMNKNKEQINPAKALYKNYEAIISNVNAVSKAAADISTRKIETVQSVDIQNDSLLLTLYDNGEIDGDTVSILLNGKVIMPMQGLTAKGISKTIYLTPEMGDSISLIMYAENLGSIPPNTGLLIVYDGNVRHEIRFSGDLKKNSAIILKRKRLH